MFEREMKRKEIEIGGNGACFRGDFGHCLRGVALGRENVGEKLVVRHDARDPRTSNERGSLASCGAILLGVSFSPFSCMRVCVCVSFDGRTSTHPFGPPSVSSPQSCAWCQRPLTQRPPSRQKNFPPSPPTHLPLHSHLPVSLLRPLQSNGTSGRFFGCRVHV